MTAMLNGSVDFDLDAARKSAADGATREAVKAPFRFRLGGQTFTVPPMTEWPIQFETFLSAGQLSAAMQELLGDEQMAEFATHRPTFGDLQALMERIGDWAGVDGLGNSKPPQRRAPTPM